MNRKAIRKILSFVLTVLLITTSITPSFAGVSHYVVTKDGVKYQYAQKDLIESYYGDKKLYNDYLSGELKALLDDKNGYIKAEDVFRYIASTNEVNVNTYTESDDAEVIEVGTVIELGADGKPVNENLEFIASDFDYDYSQYKPVMQSERDIFVITGFTKQGLEKSKINGKLTIPKTVEVEEKGVKVTKSVEGIARDAFKDIPLEMVAFPKTKGEYDFVINASAFANCGLKEVVFNEGIRAIKESAFVNNNLNEIYFPSTTLTLGNNSFAHNSISKLVFSDEVKAIQIDNYSFYDNALEEVHLPYSIFKFQGYVFKGNPGVKDLPHSELDDKDPEGTGVVELYTRNPIHLTSDTYIAKSKYHNIVNVAKEIDRTVLYATIYEAKALELSDYSEEDAHDLLDELDAAMDIFENEKSTQEAIDSSNTSLRAMIDRLKGSGADKSDLRELVSQAKGYSSELYTDETFKVLTLAIKKAENLLSDLTATDKVVEEAKEAINVAVSALVVKSNLVFTKEDFTYEGNVLTGFSARGEIKFKRNKNVVLPDQTIDGTTIEVIGPSAFENTEVDMGSDVVTPIGGIEKIKFPSQLKRIESLAFKFNCLEEVEFPSTLEYVGNLAFNGNLLKSVHLPDSVVKLGFGTFSLNRITEVNLSPNLTEISNGTFSRNIYLDKIELHEGITRIGQSSFIGCPLKTIEIPTTVKTIGRLAFSSSRLESVHIPSNVEVIEADAFKQNTKFRTLREVTFEEGLKSIGENAFMDGMISEVRLPYSLEALHEKAFQGNINVDKEAVIVKLYTTNGKHLAYETEKSKAHQVIIFESQESDFEVDKTGLITAYTGTATEVIIPGKVKGTTVVGIGDKAFYKKSITLAKIPDTVTTIGEKAFYGNDLESIDLPEALVNIEKQAFYGNDLNTLTLPNSIKKIGYGAFSKNKIATLSLPEGLKVIENGAFMMNALTEVTIPGSVEVVSTFSFAMNPNLNKLTLEEGIKEVSMNAFTKSGALSGEVTLPSTLEHIYGSSFKDTGVTSYYVKGDKESSLLEVHSTTASALKGVRFELPSKEAYIVFNASGDVEDFLVDLGTLHCTEGADNLKGYLEDNVFVKESAYHVNKNDSTGKSDIVVLAGIDWDLESVNVTTGAAVVFGTARDFTAEDLESKGADYTPPNPSGSKVKNTYKITIVLDKEKETAVVSDFKIDEIAVVVDKYFYDKVASNGKYSSKELLNGDSAE